MIPVLKDQNSYALADASADASEEVLEFGDISDIPSVVRAQLADNATAEVFRRAYNMGRASGLTALQAIDDAWGKIVEASDKTIDGRYRVTGELLPQQGQKVAGYGPLQKHDAEVDEIAALDARIEQDSAAVESGTSPFGSHLGRQHIAGLTARRQAVLIKAASRLRQPMQVVFGSNP